MKSIRLLSTYFGKMIIVKVSLASKHLSSQRGDAERCPKSFFEKLKALWGFAGRTKKETC